jgi:hypothetical protein
MSKLGITNRAVIADHVTVSLQKTWSNHHHKRSIVAGRVLLPHTRPFFRITFYTYSLRLHASMQMRLGSSTKYPNEHVDNYMEPLVNLLKDGVFSIKRDGT